MAPRKVKLAKARPGKRPSPTTRYRVGRLARKAKSGKFKK